MVLSVVLCALSAEFPVIAHHTREKARPGRGAGRPGAAGTALRALQPGHLSQRASAGLAASGALSRPDSGLAADAAVAASGRVWSPGAPAPGLLSQLRHWGLGLELQS